MAEVRNRKASSLVILLLVLLGELASSSPVQEVSAHRPKRQLPFRPSSIGSLFGPGGITKCCCKHGMPPECLHFCQFKSSRVSALKEPRHCLLYNEIYTYTCWAAGGDQLGPCPVDYVQPPPRPGSCPVDLHEEDSLYCTQATECHSDHSCLGSTKCCLSTCPTKHGNSGKRICRHPLVGNLSRCETHRKQILEQLVEADVRLNISSLQLWVPNCVLRTGDGPSYRPTQCIDASNVCFCVNPENGDELPNTHHYYNGTTTKFNCSQLASTGSKCEQDELAILHQHASLSPDVVKELVSNGTIWVPNCTDMYNSSSSRSHRHLQCQTVSGLCWCTLDNGRAILDTVIKPGAPIFANECMDYNATLCDQKVSEVIYNHRVELFGLRNADQVFKQRSFYENQPQLFVPRCRRDSKESFQKEQLTWRVHSEFSEFFCVDTSSGEELADSRLGPGEHRFLPSERKQCPFRRSHCQEMVLNTLRKIQENLKSFGPMLSFLVNREKAFLDKIFVPACEHGSDHHYGYTARQCGVSNATCWCVFRNGVAVPGTEHSNSTDINCTNWWHLCQAGNFPVISPAVAVQTLAKRCPKGQTCRSVAQLDGVGRCTVAGSKDFTWQRVFNPTLCKLCWSEDSTGQDCVQLPKDSCSAVKPCHTVGRSGRPVAIGDGMTVAVNCSLCTCNNGVLSCRNSSCTPLRDTSLLMTSCITSSAAQLMSQAACGPDGQTYPSRAAAMHCSNFNETVLKLGSCQTVDVCKRTPCTVGEKCVPTRKRCLSHPCKQFSCVSVNTNCSSSDAPSEEVCSKDGKTFPNLCHILAAGKEFAYRGPCRLTCNGKVCGADGRTYPSRCHADAEQVAIDYDGPCRQNCSHVRCPLLTSCSLRTRVSSQCCDFCGAAAFVSVNRAVAGALAEAGQVTANDQQAILTTLVMLMNSSARQMCRLRGHVNIDGLMELRTEAVDSPAAAELCADAVEEIALVINSQTTSPAMSLSALTAVTVISGNANPVTTDINSASSAVTRLVNPTAYFMSALFLTTIADIIL